MSSAVSADIRPSPGTKQSSESCAIPKRFPLQVHLEPSDISEVTSKRVLAKTADSEKMLAALFEANRGSLTANAALTADIKLPQIYEGTNQIQRLIIARQIARD